MVVEYALLVAVDEDRRDDEEMLLQEIGIASDSERG